MIKVYAAHEPGGELKPFEYDPGALDVEITAIFGRVGSAHIFQNLSL